MSYIEGGRIPRANSVAMPRKKAPMPDTPPSSPYINVEMERGLESRKLLTDAIKKLCEH